MNLGVKNLTLIKASMQIKYIVLLLLSVLIMAGYTYSLDIPQEIETPLRNIPYNFSTD